MSNALDILVDRLFDYAGIFPPASLTFTEALKTSASFPTTLKRPQLVASDMVFGTDRLETISSSFLVEQGFSAERHFRFCLLGPELTEDPKQALLTLRTAQQFNRERHDNTPSQEITSLELKLHQEIQRKPSSLKEALFTLKSEDPPFPLFIEPNLALETWRDDLTTIAALLGEVNTDSFLCGFKIRGTGPTAIDNNKIADVLQEITRYTYPFKATAGLHHPLIETARYGNHLGFINLLSSIYLLRILGESTFPREAMLDCLHCTESNAFHFGEGLRWDTFFIDTKTLQTSKMNHSFTIGSCSIHEPDEDLVRLF